LRKSIGGGGSRPVAKLSARRIIRKFELNTQEMRQGLVEDLRKLMEQAVKNASPGTKKKAKKTKHLREWSRLAAYISQTINAILREYDEKEIKARLGKIELRLDILQRREDKDELETQDRPSGEETGKG